MTREVPAPARERLRIAVQKSGRIAQASRELLARCGLAFRAGGDGLFCLGEALPVDLLLVRDDDIPAMLAGGVCELGIVGRNVLAEAAQAALELRALGFGQCRLALALPFATSYEGPQSLVGLRIATSHPHLLAQFLARERIDARTVLLNGSVEIAPRLGTADAVCDLVSTGATLAANALREVATVLASEAVLAAAPLAPDDPRAELLALLLRRLDGMLAVQESRLVMLHAPRTAVAAIAQLLPGRPRATVTPLEGAGDEVALQAVCHAAVTWSDLEAMKRAGANSLVVLPAERMLA